MQTFFRNNITRLFCTKNNEQIIGKGTNLEKNYSEQMKWQNLKIKMSSEAISSLNDTQKLAVSSVKKQNITKIESSLFIPKTGVFSQNEEVFEQALDSITLTNPQFIVGPINGFLPVSDPLFKLPSEFAPLENILQRMPLITAKGQPGLLAQGKLADVIQNELPLFDVSAINDGPLLSALFRDYTFLASAYLLEPCDIQWKKNGTYGLGRDILPKNIAFPLVEIAKKIGAKPFMEYALSYALYNYKKIDKNGPVSFHNIQLIRSFTGSAAEYGFVAVHIIMVAKSAEVVRQTLNILKAVQMKDRKSFDQALIALRQNFHEINQEMDTMWSRSHNKEFNNFRTFVMGIKNQPMFPKGVIYEGISNQPQFYRGSSGANDSIIPTIDNLMELTDLMPNSPLTDILRDFRQYRPIYHQQWLNQVYQQARALGVRNFAIGNSNSAVLYLAILDQIRDFRHRHWNFMKEYVLKFSKHSVATGGSPVVAFLPNQMRVVLNTIDEVGRTINKSKLSYEMTELFTVITQRSVSQAKVLKREVQNLKKEYPDQNI